MASEIHMPGPVCLIENTKGHLVVNPEALEILSAITQPVAVVAIVGLYRTGKSYLMNKLVGKNKGFPLGCTVKSETKGIWMWCVPHPSKSNHTLVLLDTEGLGDMEKSDPKNDSWIFALAVLLSSSFIYNSMNTINHQALEQLHYVTELTELIRAKSCPKPDDSSEFVSFFPDFIWTVRDFTLELKLDGHPITEDEYLENALKLIPGKNPQIQNSNKPREWIRHFFPKRKCFVFDRPTNDKKLLLHVEEVPEDQLDSNFQVQSENFCSYILTHAKTKTLREGILVTGNRLGMLVETYLDAINSGAVPCLENAMAALAQRENSAAVQRAADHYSQRMAQQVKFPTDTLQELLDVHTACEREAIAVFMEHSFKDKNQEFQKKLVDTMEKKKEDFVLQDEEASAKYCQAELKRLSELLMESISRGTFFVPGGHNIYLEAKKKIEQDYTLLPRKGIKANEVLQSFLQSQVVIEESILQSDKALTAGEKAIAAKQAKKEAAEKEQELLRQKQKEQQQMMEAQERSFQENIAQLKKKMERERENYMRELRKMLSHKLKVLEEPLTEGFKEIFESLNEEINRLKEEIEAAENEEPSVFSQILDVAGNMFIAVLPGAAKLVDLGMKILSSLCNRLRNPGKKIMK
uniref:Guanylate binding protein 7 n=1 Tax=Papio anubis TaxID=9555 RepID=A0A096MR16_PAPAN